MSDPSGLFSSFDPAGVVATMRQQFGLADADVTRAMGALLPAAFTGLRHTTAAPDGLQGFLGLLKGQAGQMPMPMSVQGPPQADPFSFGTAPAPTNWFFGPAPVQQAIADQVARLTGVQQDAITALMPVAATLAMGQVARPYLHGQARDLFDAFMAGYARGRPKPMPTPAAMMAGYADAVQSFWTSFLGLGDKASPAAPTASSPSSPQAAQRPAQKPAAAPAPEPDTEPPAAPPAGSILDDWFAAGRAFQSNQLKAIETVFDTLERDNG